MLRVDRNHPQRLGRGSSLSHEKEWNDLVPANHACFDFRTLPRLFYYKFLDTTR